MKDPTIATTPVPACPACRERRLHQASERNEYHPLSGHGFSGGKWSEQRLEAERRLLAAQLGAQERGPR